jgi:alpha-ribazole phosphatase
MNLRLILLSMGKLCWLTKAYITAHTDVLLSEEGIGELVANRESNLYPDADLYFTSGMTRANESLRLIKGEVPFRMLPQLEEYNFGDFELHTHDELCDNEDYVRWMEDESGETRCRGGESRAEFVTRMQDGLRSLCDTAVRDSAGTVLLLAHGGVISYFTRLFYDESLTYYEAMPKCGHGVDAIVNYDGGRLYVERLETI